MKNDLKRLIICFLIILYLEFFFHGFVFENFTLKNIIFIVVFSLTGSAFIELITSFFNEKFNKWFFILLMAFIVILFEAYFVNYQFYGNILSIYSIFHGGQVFGFLSQILFVIWQHIWEFLVLLIPLPLLFIFQKKIEGSSLNFKKMGIKFGTLFVMFLSSILLLNIDTKDIYSAKNMYYNKHVPNQMAKMFGVLTTCRLDIQRTITNFKESSISVIETKENDEKKVEYNKVDIDFDELINNETNEEINNIHRYFKDSTPSNKNKYSGYFEGKNLVSIVAEAFSPIAINEELTPTLYKLVNSGFHFNNFYTPIYYVSTSDGEYVTLNSLLPKESVWSFSKSSKNLLPYSYGNIFSKMGYTTYAFHDGTYKYYRRDLSHPNLGYTYIACGNGLEKNMRCKIWPQSDLEMMNTTVSKYVNEEHFATYYMTISGHLEYNFGGNNMAYKNKNLVKDLPYSDAIKAYIATNIELDRALESLLNQLEEAGKLDDTVIVLSADHYPYGLKNNEIAEVMEINNEKFDIHKNNLIIWNSKMKDLIEIDKYGESLDILPTVLNLMGVEFDSRLLMGRDLLSDADGLVIFNDRSWITDKGIYDADSGVFYPNSNKKVSEEYISNINTTVYNKFVISKNILETDYYRHLPIWEEE